MLDSGTLAMTSGPVYDPSGKRSGTFNSVWRREPDGSWRVVLDKGCPPCECGGTADAPSGPAYSGSTMPISSTSKTSIPAGAPALPP